MFDTLDILFCIADNSMHKDNHEIRGVRFYLNIRNISQPPGLVVIFGIQYGEDCNHNKKNVINHGSFRAP